MAPVLIPTAAHGAASELDELRVACRAAIGRSGGSDRRWHVFGVGETSREFGPGARGSLAGLGVPVEVALGQDRPGPAELPLSLTVGAWLLDDALGEHTTATATATTATAVTAIGSDTEGTQGWAAARDRAVLVMGDGTARRSVKAPGYLDERAAGYDEQIEQALRSGDPAALTALDPALGAELLAAGVPAWRAIAPALAGHSWDAVLHHSSDPYGVAYVVASWIARG